jgi:hypothetical protein
MSWMSPPPTHFNRFASIFMLVDCKGSYLS